MPRGTTVANIYKKILPQFHLPHLILSLPLSISLSLSLSAPPPSATGATRADADAAGAGGGSRPGAAAGGMVAPGGCGEREIGKGEG